jgi:hypothetical protein
MFVVICCFAQTAQAQLFGLNAQPDTLRMAGAFGVRYTTSIFSLTHNVRAFNDSLEKQGFGRIPATSLGIGVGGTAHLGEDWVISSQLYVAYNLVPAVSARYSSWFWTFGLESTYGYVLLKNDVFRLYPMGSINFNIRYMNTRERMTITPSMLNKAALPEPWTMEMWSSPDFTIGLGIGADVLIPNIGNRYYEYETGLYQLNYNIGLHLLYNVGNYLDLLTRGSLNTWSVSGMTVNGLPSASPQGLSLRIVIMQNMVKVR